MLDDKDMQKYLGGQLEYQGRGSCFRGKISSISVTGSELVVGFEWLAKREAQFWVDHQPVERRFQLSTWNADIVGSGEQHGRLHRIQLVAHSKSEFAELFPEDHPDNVGRSAIHRRQ